MKKYLEDLRRALSKTKLTKLEVEDILNDHQEMIESALAEGLSESEIIAKFGNPEQVAKEVSETEESTKEVKEFPKDEAKSLRSYHLSDGPLEISIELVAEDVVYAPSEDNQVHVLIKDVETIEDYLVEFKNNCLRIKAPKGVFFGFSLGITRSKGLFIIKIPKGIIVQSLTHKTTSSDVEMDSIKMKQGKISTVSGNVKATGITAASSSWHTVSGDLHFSGSKFNALHVSCVSGDLRLETSVIENDLEIGTVSGDAHISDSSANEVSMRTVSGDIKGVNFYPKTVALKSVSGDIVIKNDEETEIEIVKKSTLSGTINIRKGKTE